MTITIEIKDTELWPFSVKELQTGVWEICEGSLGGSEITVTLIKDYVSEEDL